MDTLNTADFLDLSYLNLATRQPCYCQLSAEELTGFALVNQEGVLTDTGILAVDTGKFTGRSPKDRYIVKDQLTTNRVHWGEVNIPFNPAAFNPLYERLITYLAERALFIRDGFACATDEHRLSLRVITETAYQNLFALNLFIRPEQRTQSRPEWTIIAAPGFKADPLTDGTRQENFAIINFSRRLILIGGTGYTGEIKKAVFSVLNFLLPQQGILPMHCAANIGATGDTAIFFGLSGTGKTTLSADPNRRLIGDDEHGWGNNEVFNFEGGCYAKTVNLSPENEPQIFDAIQPGALLENICFYPESREVDFTNISKTENTRVSYPIDYITNAVIPSKGNTPKNIFFLTSDAFGVLPPVAKLTPGQALYYFLLGYTAKVAGTEHGINEPQATFSACFGRVFLPLHPQTYAALLAKKLQETPTNVWLISTGWTGGAYGTGQRIPLACTRAIIKAALNGDLDQASYETLPLFDLAIPTSCPGVPAELLNPTKHWGDRAEKLVKLFKENYALI